VASLWQLCQERASSYQRAFTQPCDTPTAWLRLAASGSPKSKHGICRWMRMCGLFYRQWQSRGLHGSAVRRPRYSHIRTSTTLAKSTRCTGKSAQAPMVSRSRFCMPALLLEAAATLVPRLLPKKKKKTAKQQNSKTAKQQNSKTAKQTTIFFICIRVAEKNESSKRTSISVASVCPLL
jgi:hypothetical protein